MALQFWEAGSYSGDDLDYTIQHDSDDRAVLTIRRKVRQCEHLDVMKCLNSFQTGGLDLIFYQHDKYFGATAEHILCHTPRNEFQS
eukprot:scaffold98460_cov19-Prasinocladus_malaysianus.AAC.1